MTADRPSRFRRFGAVPTDLAAIFVATILVNVAVFVPIIRSTPLRVPLGLLFVFFVPGYALAATLFPGGRAADDPKSSATTDGTGFELSALRRRRIDGLERGVLSFGLSAAIVPGSALLLNYTPWGIRPVSVLTVTTVFTLLLTGTAIARRLNLPEEDRFRISVFGSLMALRPELSEPADRAETGLSVLLVISVLLAVGGVGYAVTGPTDGEQFSAVYLLSENGDDELVADEYPTEFERNESRELVFGIDNDEHETTNYTVVVVEQDTESNGSEIAVTDQQQLTRFETQLDHGETWRHEHDIEPTITGENVRIAWLVYLDGDVPDAPSMENAAYHVHLWADVDEPTGDA